MPSALRRHNLYLREMVRDIVLELVGRALYAVGAAFGYVGVDHGGFEVSVAQEFLDGADVVSVFEEVRPEEMSKGVASRTLWEA